MKGEINLGDENLDPEDVAELAKAVVTLRDAALAQTNFEYALALSKTHAVLKWAEERLRKELDQ